MIFGKNSKIRYSNNYRWNKTKWSRLASKLYNCHDKTLAKANNIYNKENIILESRYWFNPPLSSRYFLLPGSIAIKS